MDQAVENWKTAIAMDPGLSTAHYNLGTAFELTKDFDKSLECFNTAAKSNLGQADYRAARILQRLGRNSEAAERLKIALTKPDVADFSQDASRRLSELEANNSQPTVSPSVANATGTQSQPVTTMTIPTQTIAEPLSPTSGH